MGNGEWGKSFSTPYSPLPTPHRNRFFPECESRAVLAKSYAIRPTLCG